MTGRGAEAHGDLLAGKWHSMWWFDWSPARKLTFSCLFGLYASLKNMREITEALRTSCAHTITQAPGGKKMTNSTEASYLPASKYKSASHDSIYFHTDAVCVLCGHPEKRLRQNLCFIFCKKLMSVVELPFFSILYLQMSALLKCNHAAVSVPLHCDCLW